MESKLDSIAQHANNISQSIEPQPDNQVTDLHAELCVADLVRDKFRSGNDIPVDRITITRQELATILLGASQVNPIGGRLADKLKAVTNSTLELAANICDENIDPQEAAFEIRALITENALQSDTALLNWLQEHNGQLNERGAGHWEVKWKSADGFEQWTPPILSVRAAILNAMQAEQEHLA